MADEKYVSPLNIFVYQIKRYYPNANVFVYDCGLSEKSRRRLKSINGNVQIVHWNILYLPIKPSYNRRFILTKIAGLTKDLLSSFFHKKYSSKSLHSLLKQYEFEILIQNKLRIIKEHSETYGSRFVFLDADAFIINRIDEVINSDIDLAFTLRRPTEHSYEFNNCRLINAGVMFFLKGRENSDFINEWSVRARSTREFCSEQSSLARLLIEKQPEIFNVQNSTTTTFCRNTAYKLQILDCEKYNFNWLEELDADKITDSDVKILHFKNERFKTPKFKKIAHALDIPNHIIT